MTKIQYLTTLSALILFAAVSSLFAQSFSPRVSPSTVKKIDAYLAELEKVGYTGSVLVAVDGKTVVTKGYGYRDAERRVKNSPKTVSDIGSITKQFTAAAILKLEMEGKLSTDDKITKFFQNVTEDKADITIHQLLRHSSGLTSNVGKDFEKITEADFVKKVFASELRSPVGTRFGYSNIGYSLLSLIVEKVSGQSYEQYLYQNLWKPAGMEMTGYSRPKFDKDMIAVGYSHGERWGRPTEKEWAGEAPYLHLKGNGGILSTTEDMLKWDRALKTDTILSKEAKRKYYFPALRADETGPGHYGYGWDVRKTDRGTTRVWHNGTNRVLFADFYRFIDEDVTIILMSNVWQDSVVEVGRAISRIIFDPVYEPTIPAPDNSENRAFTDEVVRLTMEKGIGAGTESYRSRKKGVDIVESVINQRGYDLIEEKKLKEAIDVFKLNVYAFPRSSNAFDSLGEAYMENGDKALAIESYKKSLELDPENGNAREVLKKLEGK